jgi:hypothetical protein
MEYVSYVVIKWNNVFVDGWIKKTDTWLSLFCTVGSRVISVKNLIYFWKFENRSETQEISCLFVKPKYSVKGRVGGECYGCPGGAGSPRGGKINIFNPPKKYFLS